MKLSVHLVTWNGAKYIPFLLASLKNQTNKNWTLFILDNNSTDNTVESIQKELINFPAQSRLIVNAKNNGFAGGHNQLYAETNSEYFVLLNQDLYLEPDCLEKLMIAIASNQELAVVSPRLMKWDFFKINQGIDASLSNTIDSLGLKVWRNRRVVEIQSGEEWKNSDEKKIKLVFGVSGTMPLFRRQAINEVTFSKQEFFDSLYGSYKEDVDLAFRLQAAGYGAGVTTDSVAYHDRSAAGPLELSDAAAVKNKKEQSSWIQYHSYKNHLMTLYKNEYWQNWLLDFPWILWYELKKFGWFLLFEPRVIDGLLEVWKNRQNLQTKKKQIHFNKKIPWKQMRKWWMPKKT
ncbi:MAG: hypothetical protein A2821_00490 [Candidatus Magasanikbacteria bacterium RIFCSPHIGHO2_01_FULL_41_23]|uniref:Glycosyltransferase 2-like domain-containing protein n=1 Tax=Candidatus Magasanikbacteria bacterium RIFCSPLOWO2_01_FULL_40_15 TaxID=1798686 RepID=A0A1F6N0C1_9BACT|nr:MAG: hypothetical protein A2821_00490 [Candidatus Magasanikbacteria bacterium RIFCSPHIGHO2_01_FULL_41_23]OGH74656.1 MAG: hypothetical protein A3F22_01845 [Candidatus Magasanikbacteria bacterium RIFCSPHIGHO2_12_FULL_41_16]OGH77369.1 MAG: hypothetical protein A2983_01545 [Candidatus Magasanikbacteria bacterium RIFCSPLOWO2_01_FULL_40_15]